MTNNNFLANIVAYIENSQTALEKAVSVIKSSELEDLKYRQKVNSIVNGLEKEGSIESMFANTVKNEFYKSPSKLAEFLYMQKNAEKMIRMGSPVSNAVNETNTGEQKLLDFLFT